MRIDACKKLKSLEPHFRELLFDPSLMLSDPPAKPRVDHWQFNTRLGFDLLNEARTMIKKTLPCPMCNALITVGESIVCNVVLISYFIT